MGTLYSSYQKVHFDAEANEVFTVRCVLPSFPFTVGTYTVGVRIVVNNEESDWLLGGAGFIKVENGDFYGTGSSGFSKPYMTNYLGRWKVDRH